jgi:predicted O-methyltransferase YrrM
MPEDEGMALYRAGLRAGGEAPWLEIGSYCGKSAVYLGAAAAERNTVLYSVDHHRGSEEHQPGEGFHDARLVDAGGRVDTLPMFRTTIADAGLEEVVIGVVGRSDVVGRSWKTPLGLVFIDGGHSREAAHSDLEVWTSHLQGAGLLVIHDVFPNPSDGGRPPFEIYRAALDSGDFREIDATGSLRVLEKRATREEGTGRSLSE